MTNVGAIWQLVAPMTNTTSNIDYTFKCSFQYDEMKDIWILANDASHKDVFDRDGVHWRFWMKRVGKKEFEFTMTLIEGNWKPKVAHLLVDGGSSYTRIRSSFALYNKNGDTSECVKIGYKPQCGSKVEVSGEVYKCNELAVQSVPVPMPIVPMPVVSHKAPESNGIPMVPSPLASVSNSIQPPKSTIKTEFLEGFKSETFGDTTIVAEDGQKFRCHKDILSLRSEVFKLMFNCRMKEARENVVTFDGYDGDIVASLLSFIYTDECEIGPIADRLYVAAHHYQLDRLKVLCESALTANLNAKSIVKTFRLAKFYHIDHLLAICVNYMETHKTQLSTADLLAEALELIEVNKVQTDQK